MILFFPSLNNYERMKNMGNFLLSSFTSLSEKTDGISVIFSSTLTKLWYTGNKCSVAVIVSQNKKMSCSNDVYFIEKSFKRQIKFRILKGSSR